MREFSRWRLIGFVVTVLFLRRFAVLRLASRALLFSPLGWVALWVGIIYTWVWVCPRVRHR